MVGAHRAISLFCPLSLVGVANGIRKLIESYLIHEKLADVVVFEVELPLTRVPSVLSRGVFP